MKIKKGKRNEITQCHRAMSGMRRRDYKDGRTLAGPPRAKDGHHVVVEAEIAQALLLDPGAKVKANKPNKGNMP